MRSGGQNVRPLPAQIAWEPVFNSAGSDASFLMDPPPCGTSIERRRSTRIFNNSTARCSGAPAVLDSLLREFHHGRPTRPTPSFTLPFGLKPSRNQRHGTETEKPQLESHRPKFANHLRGGLQIRHRRQSRDSVADEPAKNDSPMFPGWTCSSPTSSV